MARTVVGRLVMQAIIDAGRTKTGATAVKGELRGMRASVASTGAAFRGLAAALPVTAVVYGFQRMMKANEDFKQELQSSFAIMGDIGDRMKTEMRAMAHEAAFQTKFMQRDAARSYYYLASAGLSPQQQKGALIPTMRFSMAGMFDAARGVDILTDTVSALGLASKNADLYMQNLVRVSDSIVMAATKANATVEQFGEALMNKGALGAKLMGYEVEEALAVLMVFADKGFAKGVEGGQALWMVLRDLKNKAVENEAAFKRMGVSVFDASGKARHTWEIMGDIERALAGKSTKQQTKDLLGLGFTQKSIAPLLTLVGDAQKILENYKIEMEAAGKTAQVAGDQLTPFNEGLHKMRAEISHLVDSGFGNWLDGIGIALQKWATGLNYMGNQVMPRLRQYHNSLMDYLFPENSETQGEFNKGLRGYYNWVADLIPFYDTGQLPSPKIAKKQQPKHWTELGMSPPLAMQHRYTWKDRLKDAFAPERTGLEMDLAARQWGITDKMAQGLYKQWGKGKLSDEQLTAELQRLSALRQIEEAEKRIAEQKQRATRFAEQQKMAARGIVEELLNPYERLSKREIEAWRLVQSGHLSTADWMTASERWRRETNADYFAQARLKVPDYSPIAAKAKGSAEAYSAMVRDVQGNLREKAIERIAKEQLEQDKQTAQNTGRVAKLLEEEQTVNF